MRASRKVTRPSVHARAQAEKCLPSQTGTFPVSRINIPFDPFHAHSQVAQSVCKWMRTPKIALLPMTYSQKDSPLMSFARTFASIPLLVSDNFVRSYVVRVLLPAETTSQIPERLIQATSQTYFCIPTEHTGYVMGTKPAL